MRQTISERSISDSLKIRGYLEKLRMQGMKDAPRAVFYVFLASVALCVSVMTVITSYVGIDLVRTYFNDFRLLALVLLSLFVGWAAVSMVRFCLSLWLLGGREDA